MLSRRRLILVLGATFCTSLLTALDQTVVATAMPKMVGELNGFSLYAWVYSAYFLGATATVVVAGKLSDLGRKSLFMASAAVFGIGSLFCGAALDMPQLVAARALQGIGAGCIQTMSQALMGDLFPPRERGKWQSINASAFILASIVGPAMGGAIADHLSWRWIFLINVPLCAIALVALVFALPAFERAGKPRIDWAGGLLLIVSVLGTMLILTWGGREFAWASPEILALAVLVAVSAVLFRTVERRAPEPIAPPGLLRGPVLPFSAVGMFSMGICWFGLLLVVPLFFQGLLGLTATQSGSAMTPAIFCSGITSIVSGVLISRVGRYRFQSVLGGCATITGLLLLLFWGGLDQGRMIVGLVLASAGMPMIVTPFTIAAQNVLARDRMGAGMGLLILFRQVGATVGTAAVGTLAVEGRTGSSGATTLTGIRNGLILLLISAALMLLMAVLSKELPLRGREAYVMAASD